MQVNHGGTEMGQGLYVKVAQVVAEEFGIGADRVRITATRTDKVPNTAATAASAGSDLNGMAARRAARTIRGRLAGLAARLYQVREADVVFESGMVRVGAESVPFERLAALAFTERVSLSSTGYYATPKISWDRDTASGRPFLYFACGAACSEVTVDTATGEMRVDRVDVLHDAGRSLNPAIDMGQIEGGFVQGMGWLTTEELVFGEDGRLLTHAPSTYKIPTCSDVPADFRVALFEPGRNREPTIHRSKAVGEPPLMLALSVFSAVTHALASLARGACRPSTPRPRRRRSCARRMRCGRSGLMWKTWTVIGAGSAILIAIATSSRRLCRDARAAPWTSNDRRPGYRAACLCRSVASSRREARGPSTRRSLQRRGG